MSSIKNLFSTPVLLDSLPHELTHAEIDYLKNLHLKDNLYNLRSQESYVLESETMSKLKKCILEYLQQFFADIYKPANGIEIYLTQSWINVSDIGSQHHPHSHPNSFISGTFYIEADREIDTITFYKEDFSTFKLIPQEYNIFNSSSWHFNVGTNDIVLFPSNLKHSVDTVKQSNIRKQRVSLSFNTFLKGPIGSRDFLSELIL